MGFVPRLSCLLITKRFRWTNFTSIGRINCTLPSLKNVVNVESVVWQNSSQNSVYPHSFPLIPSMRSSKSAYLGIVICFPSISIVSIKKAAALTTKLFFKLLLLLSEAPANLCSILVQSAFLHCCWVFSGFQTCIQLNIQFPSGATGNRSNPSSVTLVANTKASDICLKTTLIQYLYSTELFWLHTLGFEVLLSYCFCFELPHMLNQLNRHSKPLIRHSTLALQTYACVQLKCQLHQMCT